VKILAVDTALGACSVAILADEKILAHSFEEMVRGHAERLAPMVQEAMANAGILFPNLIDWPLPPARVPSPASASDWPSCEVYASR